MKLLFHIHTIASYDSSIRYEDILDYCRRHKISAVAVCDHNKIEGGPKLAKIAGKDLKVIIGEEIKSKSGEIIGLYLKKRIRPGLSAGKTIEAIKKQGGIVVLPHPGETLRQSAISKKDCLKIIDSVDAVEVFNSRTTFNRDNRWASQLASKYDELILAGSDAHSLIELHRSENILPPFTNRKTFLASLKKNRIGKREKTGLIIQLVGIVKKKFRSISKIKNHPTSPRLRGARKSK